MIHKGVRLILRLDDLTVIDVSSLVAHFQANLEGACVYEFKAAQKIELLMWAVEETDEIGG